MILVALMLPFLVGLTILVVDAGRLYNMDASLQNNVDAIALAGAAELDRRPDAHIRACLAMSTLVRNETIFTDGDPLLEAKCGANGEPADDSDVEWKWLRTIPEDNCSLTSPGTGNCSFEFSDHPATTFFIAVTSRRTAGDFAMLFPATFIGGSDPQAINRTAVAGLSFVACRPTPLMICNPWEASGMNTVAELRTKIGSITDAREYGAGGPTIGSGQFGLLDPAGVVNSCNESSNSSDSVVETLKWQLAGAGQATCQSRNGLCPKPGVVAVLDNAVNTRFDIYSGPFRNLVRANSDLLYPAARTIWHSLDMSKSRCEALTHKETTDPATWVDLWYPRSESWDRVAYFRANEYDSTNSSLGFSSTPITLPSGKQKTLGTLTRYETYLWEVSNGYTKPAENTCFANEVDGGETILNQKGLEGRRDRRDLYAPIVNCGEVTAAIDQGVPFSFNGSSTQLPLPYVAIAKFFITEPMNRTYATDGAESRGTTGQYAWPGTCPQFPQGWAPFAIPLGSEIPLQAGRTYFLKRPTDAVTYFEFTIPAETTSPTITTLADGFAQAAADANKNGNYIFCGNNSIKTPNTLFVASNDNVNDQSNKKLSLFVNNQEFEKRIWLELVEVFASDNGGDVARDIVKLYR